jgi:hypothetical protein
VDGGTAATGRKADDIESKEFSKKLKMISAFY